VDVARKLLILARECGLSLELEDIQIENLIPESCRSRSIPVDQFIIQLKDVDDEFERRRKEAS
jgi:aspartokinase/homoserine dehydrogenase 1